jgi:hypothetical protein
MNISSSTSKKGLKRKLDTTASSQSLWLVKIPTNVAEVWRSSQCGESLGSLAIESVPSSIPGKKPRSKVSIQLRSDIAPESSMSRSSSVESADAPPTITEFTLDEIQNMKSTSSNMVVFDSNEGQDAFSLKGHVSTFWSLTPKDNEQYRQAVKNRQVNASTKIHSVKSIDSKTVFEHSNKAQEVGFKPPAYVTERKRDVDSLGAGGAPRRVRGEKATEKELNELKKNLLKVFGGPRDYLTFKEINQYCQAYESDLRELVKKYCDYHAKGSLKTYYELKPEYKGSK